MLVALCCKGGYDLLGRTKDQIRTTKQVDAALNTCTALKLDALVIIGGIFVFLLNSMIFYDVCYWSFLTFL